MVMPLVFVVFEWESPGASDPSCFARNVAGAFFCTATVTPELSHAENLNPAGVAREQPA